MLTESSLWRLTGKVELATWQRVVLAAGGPPGLASDSAWRAAGELSRMCLAQLRMESSYGTNWDANNPASFNPLNLQVPGGFAQFSNWAAGVQGWQDRITDPTYKDGVYEKTDTIREFIFDAYAPPRWNDSAGYVATILELMNSWKVEGLEMLDIRQALNWRGGNRPGTKFSAEPLRIGFHDTDNTALFTGATWHKNWITSGASVSFSFVVDDTGIAWQMLRLDEIGYHAADGCDSREHDEGCFATAAIEMCRNGDNWKAYSYVKDLMAAIIAGDPRIDYGSRSHKDFSVDRIWTHRDMSREYYQQVLGQRDGKYCPRWALDAGVWPGDTIEGVKARLARIVAPTPIQYAKPFPVPAGTRIINGRLYLGIEETYQLAQPATPLQWADPASLATGPELPKGEVVETSHVVKDIGESSELTLVLTDGSRIPGAALVAA